MRSLWAVACAASVSGSLLSLAGGCTGTKSQVKEFNRMEVGEGPGAVLSQMIKLQKEPGGQRIEAHPVPVSPGEGTDITGFPSDVQPAIVPPGTPPLPVQTDVQSTKSPPVDPVPPVTASVKPPAPIIASPPFPAHAPPKETAVREPAYVKPPAPAPQKKEPATVIASVKPDVPEKTPLAPVLPVPHTMTLKRKSALLTTSRETPSSPPAASTSAREKEKAMATGFSGGSKYRIGPEDVLHIDVWGNPELTRDATVRPDGKISLPLIQDVQAEGLTAAEVSDVIRQKLREFLKGPEVAVIVTQINAPKVFVIGNVTRPGPYPLRGDISVLQALSLAGGFTPFASPKKIKVISTLEGEREVYKINYYNIIGKDREGDYILKPGDTIVVP